MRHAEGVPEKALLDNRKRGECAESSCDPWPDYREVCDAPAPFLVVPDITPQYPACATTLAACECLKKNPAFGIV